MSFKDRLRLLRKQKGFTQETLAQELGVSSKTVTNYESGKHRPKRKKVYDKLAEIFDVDIEYLVNGADQQEAMYRLDFKTNSLSQIMVRTIDNVNEYKMETDNPRGEAISRIIAREIRKTKKAIKHLSQNDPPSSK